MKIAILIHENDQWVSYPHDNSKIDHVSTTTSGECFFFDPVERSATSAMPQQATKDDPRAGNLYISLKFDENELNWFLNDLSCIKGFKEWMKNITKAKAKEYALEPLSKLPEAEIKGKAKEFDENSAPLNDAEKKIALQMMTAVIQTIIQNENPKIFVGAKGQRDDLVIAVLKSLPKALRKVTVSMPWSAGMDLARITITDEDKLPNISSPRYVVSESSDALMTQYPNRFAVAEMFFEDNCWAEDKSFEQEDVSVVCKFVELAEEKERKLIRGWYESWVKSGRSQDLSEIVKKDRFKRELDDNNIQKRFTEKDYSDIWACYNAAYKIDKDIKYDQVIKLYDYCKKVVKDKKNTIPEILNNPDFCRLCIEAIKEGKNLEALKVYEFCEDGKNIIGQQHPVLGLCEYWIKVNSEKKNATFEKISYVYSKFGDLDLSFYEFLTEIVSWEDVKYFDHTYFEKLYNLYSDLPDKSKFRNYYKCYIKAVDIKVELSVILTSDFYEFCANVVKENEDPDPAYLLRIYEIRRQVDHNKHDLFDSAYYKCCNDARTDEELRSVVLDLDFCRWYINVAANNAELSAFDNVRCFKLCKKYFKKEWEEPNAGKRFHNLGKIYELYRKVYKILDEQCFARFYKLCKETGSADQPNITDFARFYAWFARTKKYSRFTPARVELSRILTSDVYKFYEKVARLQNYKDMKPSEISALCGNYLKAVKFEDEGRLVKADEVFKGYSQEVLDIFKGIRSKKSDKNKGKRGRKTVSKWDGRKLFAGLCVVVLAVGVVAAWKFGFEYDATDVTDSAVDTGTNLSEEVTPGSERMLSIDRYRTVQDGIYRFMTDHNIIGSVFAYKPSNGDVYCMASNGAQIDKNLDSYTPGATIMPLNLLLLKTQGRDLNKLEFQVKNDDYRNYKDGDSYFVKVDYDENKKVKKGAKAVRCTGLHKRNAKGQEVPQSAINGLGNSCLSFFARSAELLDLEQARETLEAMDFYVEKYDEKPEHTKDKKINIDNISYIQSVFPLEDTMKHNYDNIQNFIGQGNLLVSPIDMAVWTALFGKLSQYPNSEVYFPRIFLPACEKTENLQGCNGSRELLLTEKIPENEKKQIDDGLNSSVSIENDHVAKLSNFVSTHKKDIMNVGRIWAKAFWDHYRRDKNWPANKHLGKGTHLTGWSYRINMAQVGEVKKLLDETNPAYIKCQEEIELEKKEKCLKDNEEKYSTRTQGTLAFYSEGLDLAAYIVIENYDGVHAGNSKATLDEASLVLSKFVEDAIETEPELPIGLEDREKELRGKLKWFEKYYNQKTKDSQNAAPDGTK